MIKIPKKWKIYNIFQMLMLKQNIIKKEQIDKNMTVYEAVDNKKYKVKVIWDSTIYTNKAKGYLLGLYCFIAWKGYSKEKNTWKLSSAI